MKLGDRNSCSNPGSTDNSLYCLGLIACFPPVKWGHSQHSPEISQPQKIQIQNPGFIPASAAGVNAQCCRRGWESFEIDQKIYIIASTKYDCCDQPTSRDCLPSANTHSFPPLFGNPLNHPANVVGPRVGPKARPSEITQGLNLIYQLLRNTHNTFLHCRCSSAPNPRHSPLASGALHRRRTRWDGAILVSPMRCQPHVRAPGTPWVPALHLPRTSSWAARLYKLRKEVTQG